MLQDFLSNNYETRPNSIKYHKGNQSVIVALYNKNIALKALANYKDEYGKIHIESVIRAGKPQYLLKVGCSLALVYATS